MSILGGQKPEVFRSDSNAYFLQFLQMHAFFVLGSIYVACTLGCDYVTDPFVYSEIELRHQLLALSYVLIQFDSRVCVALLLLEYAVNHLTK